MQKYICKCGKTFEKSTKAETTGYAINDYSPQHECYGCPFIVTERDWITKEVVKRECRATPKITYLTRCCIGTEKGDFTACKLYSLDLTFVKRVMNYINSLDGAEETSGNCIPDEWRAADFGKCYSLDDCFGLAIFDLYFKKNKEGTEARRLVKERFFYEDGIRRDMTEDTERETVLMRIQIAKENAGNSFAIKTIAVAKANEKTEDKSMAAPKKFNFNSFISENNQVKKIPLDMLVPYHNHKFKLYEGERLNDMVQSVRSNGVIIPIIVRPVDGGDTYEILAGHNRTNAARLAGLKDIPAFVRENLTEEEAEIYVVETNVMQRGFDDLSITERAAVVAARHSAMFDEDKRRAIERELALLNGEEVDEGDDSDEKKSKLAAVGESYGLGKDSVARLVRIDKLVDELKPYVDNGSIAIRAAVNLSYLLDEEQRKTAEMVSDGNSVDMKKSAMLKELSAKKQLNNLIIEAIITGQFNPNVKQPKPRAFKIKSEIAEKYFPPDWDEDKVQEIITAALEMYYNNFPSEREGR